MDHVKGGGRIGVPGQRGRSTKQEKGNISCQTLGQAETHNDAGKKGTRGRGRVTKEMNLAQSRLRRGSGCEEGETNGNFSF